MSNKIIPEVQKQNIGNAGEYYIAAVLSALNFTTTITLGRAERYDILAVSPRGQTYKFSVKTRLEKEKSAFTLSEKDEKGYSDDLFYILIRLNNLKSLPEYWVIPSKIVSKVIGDSHRKWLADPGRNGRKHQDNKLRKIPITPAGCNKKYYPESWEKEMKNYYKNFDLVK